MTSVIGFQIPVWDSLNTGHQGWRLTGALGKNATKMNRNALQIQDKGAQNAIAQLINIYYGCYD